MKEKQQQLATDPSESHAEAAHRKLEELIVTLELPPGSKWSEESLGELISIGRTPVREAVKRLQNDSLLRIIPKHGVMVAEIDLQQQLLVVELRRELEVFITRRATRRASVEERAQLGEMADVMETAGIADVRSYLRHLFHVNRTVARLAGNPFAEKAISPLLALSRRFYFKFYPELRNLETVGKLHAARARAISKENEVDALQAVADLMDVIEEYTHNLFYKSVGALKR